MTLPLNTDRCQGRTQHIFGSKTLCEQCIDCRRRTEIPDSDSVVWIEPLRFRNFWMSSYCPMYIGSDEVIA